MRNYLTLLMLGLLASCAVPHGATTTVKPFPVAHSPTAAPSHKTADVAPAPDMQTMLSKKSDDFLYLASKSALDDGDYGMAYALLKILAERSDQLLPQLELARLYLDAKQPGKAETLLQPWLQRYPLSSTTTEHDDAIALHQLYAAALQNGGKVADAVVYLQQLLQTVPGLQSIRVQLTQLFLEQQQLDQASALVEQGLKLRESAMLLNFQTDIALRKGDLALAKRSVLRLEAISPNDERIPLLHSGIEMQSGDSKKAEAILRSYLAKHPAALQVASRLGQLLVQQKRINEAITVYSGMLQYGDAVVEIYSALSLLYYDQQKYREAADALIEALRLEPDNETFHFYLAVNLDFLRDYDSARKHYERISPAHERYTMSQLRLAAFDMQDKKLNASESRLLKLVEEHPDFADAWSMLSAVYLQQEAYQKLLDNTRLALSLKELPDALLLNRAVAFDHFKRYDDVEQTIGVLLKRNPDHAEGLNFLAYSLAERGERLDEAEGYARHALKLQPDNGFYLDSLAWIYYQRGVYAEAIRIQHQALEKAEHIDPVMFDHLGDMLWRSGDQKAARQAWKEALNNEAQTKRAGLEQKIERGL